jgi:SAM-dependent methyltransferase
MMTAEPYDRLAPHYRRFAETRATYLDAVDRYVIEHARPGGRMLDVGSGDGVRAVRIARAIGASYLVLSEPSEGMHRLASLQLADEIWQVPAEQLYDTIQRFDVITCLWNVLGHLPGRDARVLALAGMRRLLAPGGEIFCDVNNRHNARAYGRTRVLLRRFIDGVMPDERRGDARFEWQVAGERIAASGHLFTPREVRMLAADAGLGVVEERAIDYVTGEPSDCPREGQLLYRLAAREASEGDRL